MSTDKSIVTESGHHVPHHFNSAHHEYSASKQGIWLFLVTEVMMFGAAIMAYAMMKNVYPGAFAQGATFLDWKMGFINTLVLITSSFTMVLGIHYAQKRDAKKASLNLWITVICGAIFMVIKYFEYTHKFHIGIMPGKFFNADLLMSSGALGGAAMDPQLPLYFSYYFVLTGIHGLHVLIGMGLVAWVAIRASRNEFGPDYYTPVEGVGLFWHLVDLVWIYLFPMLYLVD